MNKELKEIIEDVVMGLMRNGDDIENELDNDKEFEGYKNLKTEIHKYANDCFDKLLDEYEENK